MKKFKAKGFTLIELIVVMAIFGIIMFGAMQLIPSVMKMMVQSSVHEDGNAAVSSISNYLEGELAPAEYLIAANYIPEDDGKDLVKEFVLSYYEGALANGSTPDNPIYGNGKVHVMTIDNNQNGKISKYVYNVKFDVPRDKAVFLNPDNEGVNLVSYDDFITGLDYEHEYAINKAYYDSYNFVIKPGVYPEKPTNEDGEGVDENDPFDNPVEYENLINDISSNNTSFTIEATTNRRHNNTFYSFRTAASMSLTNIHHRRGAGVSGTYYVIDQTVNGINVENTISDITKNGPLVPLSTHQLKANKDANDLKLSRHYGYVATATKLKFSEPEPDDKGSFTFIYSYGSEICLCGYEDGKCPNHDA